MNVSEFTSWNQQMILTVLTAIIDRFERHSDYPFLDTKLDIVTGEDFDCVPDEKLAYRTKKYIYSWIQGRGLEALAGHYHYLADSGLSAAEQADYARRIKQILQRIADAMEGLRQKLNGRMWFIINTDGVPQEIADFYRPIPLATIPAGANYSELFYFKGLYAAAAVLKNSTFMQTAASGFKQVVQDIAHGKFHTDQQAFDPQNPVTFVPGKVLQGPKMIALGGLALLMANDDATADWPQIAADFITDILTNHVNVPGRYPDLLPYGFIEALGADGKPFPCGDISALGDPGHAGEVVGLAGKCLRTPIFQRRFPELCEKMRQILPQVLKHNFELGFNAEAGGICKSVNLVTGRKFNSDMPWWNLPETMRAAAFMHPYLPDAGQILSACFHAFKDKFVNPAVYMMAYQNRNAAGQVVRTVPATPDADPGYHTNLSIIDTLYALKGK